MAWRFNRARNLNSEILSESRDGTPRDVKLAAEVVELRAALADVDVLKTRYFNLCNLHNIGFIKLNEVGFIADINTQGAALLSIDQKAVLGRKFQLSILAEDQGVYSTSRKLLSATGLPQTCELRMFRNSAVFWAGLNIALEEEQGVCSCRIIISDITQRKQLELQREQEETQWLRTLAEKDTAMREMYHRIKNNLQVVSSLMRMQAELLNDHDASAALTDCQQRIRSMALIHEHLYGNGYQEEINFSQFTRSLMSELSNSYGAASQIRYTLNTTPTTLHAEKRSLAVSS